MNDDPFDGITEARDFCKDVVDNIQRYKLFPGEVFEDTFFAGVIATTHDDAHGESLTLRALRAMERRAKDGRLWVDIMHDPTIQPAGRVIAAKVFKSPRDGAHLLVGVSGQYSTQRMPKFQDIGITDETLSLTAGITAPPQGDEDLRPVLGFDKNDGSEEMIRQALSELPRGLKLPTERHVRKALEPVTIITLGICIAALLKRPFFEELEKEAAKALINWLRTSLFPRLCKQKSVLFQVADEVNGCLVQFVSPAKDPAILMEAMKHLSQGARSATALLDKARDFEFEKVVFEYNEQLKRWVPLHAISRKYGVISERPQLIAMDQLKSFSISGVAGKPRLTRGLPASEKPSSNKALPRARKGKDTAKSRGGGARPQGGRTKQRKKST